MNRFWNFFLVQLLLFGCKGQAKESKESPKEVLVDSTDLVVVSDSLKVLPKDTVVALDSTVVEKPVQVAKKIKVEPKMPQDTVSIWDEDQVRFLRSVEKILLFDVHQTEISRKVVLNSELNKEAHQNFIQVLLNGSNYDMKTYESGAEKRRFVPRYQMLLEKGEEKLTLMFDVDGPEMMVANLMQRKRYAIENGIIDEIEDIKKK